jgi:hypothetical protein
MKFQILLAFYRNINLVTIGVSLFICFLFWQAGETKWLGMFLWTKLITNSLALLFFHLFSSNRLYFFHNLGYTTLRLYLVSFCVDLMVWTTLMTVTSFFI